MPEGQPLWRASGLGDPDWSPSRTSEAALVEAGSRLLFVSGQVGRPLRAGDPMPEDLVDEATNAFERLALVLRRAGAEWTDVALLRFYATSTAAFEAVRTVRQRYLIDPWPAATGIVVVGLAAPELHLEIEATVVLHDRKDSTP